MMATDDTECILIAAVAENGVIGNDGNMPWYEPDDLQHFQDTTIGHPVIMGRTTYDSLPDNYRPLPERTSIVLTSRQDYGPESVLTANSLEDAFEVAAQKSDTVYVAGGASVYEQVLEQKLVDRMVITGIPETPDGDTYFPDWNHDKWNEADTYRIADHLRVHEYVPR